MKMRVSENKHKHSRDTSCKYYLWTIWREGKSYTAMTPVLEKSAFYYFRDVCSILNSSSLFQRRIWHGYIPLQSDNRIQKITATIPPIIFTKVKLWPQGLLLITTKLHSEAAQYGNTSRSQKLHLHFQKDMVILEAYFYK